MGQSWPQGTGSVGDSIGPRRYADITCLFVVARCVCVCVCVCDTDYRRREQLREVNGDDGFRLRSLRLAFQAVCVSVCIVCVSVCVSLAGMHTGCIFK